MTAGKDIPHVPGDCSSAMLMPVPGSESRGDLDGNQEQVCSLYVISPFRAETACHWTFLSPFRTDAIERLHAQSTHCTVTKSMGMHVFLTSRWLVCLVKALWSLNGLQHTTKYSQIQSILDIQPDARECRTRKV